MSNVFVFRPGQPPSHPNVFDNWGNLMQALSSSAVGGRKIIEFDDSGQNPPQPCVIPAEGSPHDMTDVTWAGFGPRPGRPRAVVEIADGARFTNLRMVSGQITIVSKATRHCPIADFPAGVSQVQIGMRDDCGATQIVNQGTLPLFDAGSHTVVFFLQNCLLGVSTPGLPSLSPLIRVVDAQNQVVLNLLGQTNVGPNVARTENGARVLVGALSLGSQLAEEQSSITGTAADPHGVLRIGPLGRIQREIIPSATEPPMTGTPPVQIAVPNALFRCDGRLPNAQVLPPIVGGFSLVPGGDALYTGGQELVYSEVMGGPNLSVSPSPGDTIDGQQDPVRIGRYGSRTFASDGRCNWITISVVPGRRRPALPEAPDFDVFT